MENINNVYANIEDIFYNYCINVPFKLINIPPNNMTSTISYAIKYILNVKDFIYSMREIIKKDFNNKILTLALYENIGSLFKSDYVGEYYDNTIEDLTFWWEEDNKHWD